MKRQISVILFLSLFLYVGLCATSLAESSVDVSGMSTEELIKLKDEIITELYNKAGLVSLPKGEYVCGSDIAPGSYVISLIKNEYGSGSVKITVYASPVSRTQYEDAYKDYQLKWALLGEAVENNSSVSIEVPEVFDSSQYYVSSYEAYSHAGDTIRVNISDGQLLYVDYDGSDFYVFIEQATGLFMQ